MEPNKQMYPHNGLPICLRHFRWYSPILRLLLLGYMSADPIVTPNLIRQLLLHLQSQSGLQLRLQIHCHLKVQYVYLRDSIISRHAYPLLINNQSNPKTPPIIQRTSTKI